MKKLALATAMIVTGVVGAQAQQQSPPAQTQPPAATTRTDQRPTSEAKGPWSIREYLHTAVYNTTGERIGDVNDVIVDDSGKLVSIVIGVGGFLGIGEKDVALTPDKVKRMVYNDGNTYLTVNATKQELEALPKYARPRA